MAAAPMPLTPQVVGNEFVTQYYKILHHSPELVHKFYKDISKLGRPEEDGSMSITTTMQAINAKIVEHSYGDLRAEIKSVDSQESFNGGIHVLVTGYLSRKDDKLVHFAQSFFLAPQHRGYFVLNDMFRYVENHVSVPSVSGQVYNPPENGDVPITMEEEEEERRKRKRGEVLISKF